jgi:hypothetical protein
MGIFHQSFGRKTRGAISGNGRCWSYSLVPIENAGGVRDPIPVGDPQHKADYRSKKTAQQYEKDRASKKTAQQRERHQTQSTNTVCQPDVLPKVRFSARGAKSSKLITQ